MKTHVCYFLGFLTVALAAQGAEFTDSAEIHFRQSVGVIEPDFKDNKARLDSLAAALNRPASKRILSVKVVGSASPEGTVAINRSLSERRAEAIFDYYGLNDSLTTFDFIGRDWAGLTEMVLADESTPERDSVLSLLGEINNSLASGVPDSNLNVQRLKSIGNGEAYRYMFKRMFPALRFSKIYINSEPALKGGIVAPGLLFADIQVDCPTPRVALRPLTPRKPFYMALKTNLLYDAAAIPNIGAEFYAGKNWSVIGNWAYGWWDKDRTHRYWRAYGGELGVRRWFGKAAEAKPLTGHHLGLVAGVFTYDFELGGKGYMGGKPGHSLWDRCLVTGGVEYGYSLPIAHRLNLDFSIALGYAGGKVVEYTPRGGQYVWERTKHVNWFGPTKAEIALVWLIGHGNTNSKKGGIR